MKRRDASDQKANELLFAVLAGINDPKQMESFMVDLCTPAELEALADRWRTVPLIKEGMSYRTIHEETGVSVTTIGRVARHMSIGAGGYEVGLATHRRLGLG